MRIPTVDIVVVNWNAGEALHACLDAVRASRRERHRLASVVVVDNGSTDGSLACIEGAFGAADMPLTIDRAGRNLGFAAACNRGAAHGDGDYVLFLNPDTRVFPDAIDTAVAFMEDEANARVGICGAQMRAPDGRVQASCAVRPDARRMFHRALGLDRLWPHRFPGPVLAGWAHDETRRVDHVIGAFYLVRRSVFDALGGFDERFFVYLEDLDFSVRAAEAGWEVAFVAEARVEHVGGGASASAPTRRLVYSTHSRLRYVARHFGAGVALVHGLVTLCVEPVIRVAGALVRLRPREAGVTVAAWAALWGRVLADAARGRPAARGRVAAPARDRTTRADASVEPERAAPVRGGGGRDRVVIVAPWWHLRSHPGRVRAERFVRAVEAIGARAVVVAAGARSRREREEHADVITVRDPLGLYRDAARGAAAERPAGASRGADEAPPSPATPSRRPSRIRRALAYRLFVPDPSVAWARSAARDARVRRAARGARAVLASSPPESVHVAAERIARRAGIGVIMDMRDGWLDEPLRGLLRSSAVRRWIEGRVERRVCERAAAITVTSEAWRDALVARYPHVSDRVVVIPNAYPASVPDIPREACSLCRAAAEADGIGAGAGADEGVAARAGADPGENAASDRAGVDAGESATSEGADAGAGANAASGRALRLLHAGRFTASRSTQRPEVLLRVLARAGVPVELECIGALTDDDRRAIAVAASSREAGVRVRMREPVDRDVLLAHLPHADGLVVMSMSRAAIPAKAFECIAAGRPVLAVTPRESATWRMAPGLDRFVCVDPDAPDDEAIARFVEACRRPGIQRDRPVEYEEETLRRRFVEEVLVARVARGRSGVG